MEKRERKRLKIREKGKKRDSHVRIKKESWQERWAKDERKNSEDTGIYIKIITKQVDYWEKWKEIRNKRGRQEVKVTCKNKERIMAGDKG